MEDPDWFPQEVMQAESMSIYVYDTFAMCMCDFVATHVLVRVPRVSPVCTGLWWGYE